MPIAKRRRLWQSEDFEMRTGQRKRPVIIVPHRHDLTFGSVHHALRKREIMASCIGMCSSFIYILFGNRRTQEKPSRT